MQGSQEHLVSCQDIVFAGGTFRVEVVDHSSIDGLSSFAVRMWMIGDDGMSHRLVIDGEPAEIHAPTEALALSSTVTFLASRFGALSEYVHQSEDFGTSPPVGSPMAIK